VKGVFIGLTELKGTVESDNPITAYISGAKCVYCKWEVQEHWSRITTETYKDARGRENTRTKRESGWKTVANGIEHVPFYLRDEKGIIRINPEGASIRADIVINKICTRADPLYYEKGPKDAIPDSDHLRRFQETIISLHAPIYVLGQARERKDIVAAEIAKDKSSSVFIISTKSEEHLAKGYNNLYRIWFCIGLLAVLAGISLGQILTERQITWQFLLWPSLVYILVFCTGWFWLTYNSMVTLYQRLKQGRSQIEVQLKRRNDLIPSVSRVLQGYVRHEKETQRVISEMRKQTEATILGESGISPEGIYLDLRVIVERYPELKASKSFLKFQDIILDAEHRIALARDYYNEIATFYNTRLEILPDRLVALIARLRPVRLFSSIGFERPLEDVKLEE